MRIAVAFRSPAPIPIDVRSPMSPDAAVAELEEAFRATNYMTPDRNSHAFMRVNGEVFRRHVTLEARPYFMPGIASAQGTMNLRFTGMIHADGDGARLSGFITAPLNPLAIAWTAAINVILVLLVVVTERTIIGLVFVIISTFLLQIFFAWGRAASQRMAFRGANDVVRFLRAAFSAGPSPHPATASSVSGSCSE